MKLSLNMTAPLRGAEHLHGLNGPHCLEDKMNEVVEGVIIYHNIYHDDFVDGVLGDLEVKMRMRCILEVTFPSQCQDRGQFYVNLY